MSRNIAHLHSRSVLRLTLATCLFMPPAAFGQIRSQIPLVPVPNVVGQTEADALVALRRNGLRARIDTVFITDDVGVGVVAKQNPLPPARVPRGYTVSIAITAYGTQPTHLVGVPDLVGSHVRDARTRLAADGLQLGRVIVRDRFDSPAGIVFDQKPRPTQQVPPRTPVDVAIASDTTIVPRLTGLHQEQAPAALARNMLRIGSISSAPSDAASGTVIDQHPSPGTRVRKDSPVSVNVARVPPVVTVGVPDLSNLTVREAARLLADSALELGKPSVRDNFDVPAGVVLDQKPAPGTRVVRGSRIHVLIASDTTEVPPVLRLNESEARAALARRQLTLSSAARVESDAPRGSIITQTPEPRTRVRKESLVAVDIAIPPPPPPPETPLQEPPNEEGQTPPPPPSDSVLRVIVPRVTGLPRDSAVAVLTAQRLLAGEVTARPAVRDVGTILEQSVPPLASVPVGTAIDLVVAMQQMVEVPDLSGRTLDEARSVLESVGLRLMGGADIRTRDSQAGDVVTQNPAARAQVPAGSAVEVNLAAAPIPWALLLAGLAMLGISGAAALQHRQRRAKRDHVVTAPPITFVPQATSLDITPVPGDWVARGRALQLVGNPHHETFEVYLRYDTALTKEAVYD